jgi:hypothetical protein
MQQVKQVQRKSNGPKVSPAKQFAAIAAVLAMSALMMLGILAIGGSAYLSAHAGATVASVAAGAMAQLQAAFAAVL